MHCHALCPVGKLGVVGAGQRAKQGQILPPPLLDGLALRCKLHVQHLQQGTFFCPRALCAACRMTQKRVFLLQCPHIAAVGGKVAGVQLAQRRVQKPPPSFRRPFDKAQVPGVEHHSRKAARKACRPFGRCTVHRCIPPGPLCVRRAYRCLLYTSEIRTLVSNMVYAKLMEFFEENPGVAKAILEKATQAARARAAASLPGIRLVSNALLRRTSSRAFLAAARARAAWVAFSKIALATPGFSSKNSISLE